MFKTELLTILNTRSRSGQGHVEAHHSAVILIISILLVGSLYILPVTQVTMVSGVQRIVRLADEATGTTNGAQAHHRSEQSSS